MSCVVQTVVEAICWALGVEQSTAGWITLGVGVVVCVLIGLAQLGKTGGKQ